MGCKQYARMLGLSREYPYILYTGLGKWDSAPLVLLFHMAKKSRRQMPLCHRAANLQPLRQHSGADYGPAFYI